MLARVYRDFTMNHSAGIFTPKLTFYCHDCSRLVPKQGALMISRLVLGCALVACAVPAAASDRATIHALVALHAHANRVPEALVHRIIQRESGYNPVRPTGATSA